MRSFIYLLLASSILLMTISSCHHEANEYSLKGIDVSHYQRQIDWEAVESEVEFVFVKATEATNYQDSFFQRNWEAIGQLGIPKGAYHFFRPQVSAEAQAGNFIRTVNLESGDLPPVLDLETLDGVSPKALVPKVALWLELIEQHYEVKPILYASVKFYEDYLEADFPDHPIWIARYNRKAPPIEGWKFWQYSAYGTMEGIDGDVDLNVFYGNLKELEELLIP
jgi:lysozyme